MRKSQPQPTWAVFALSGLGAWLIDNWTPRKFICFLLIFIPEGDISTVPSLPWATGAKQKDCHAGLWELLFPNPRRLLGWEKSQH